MIGMLERRKPLDLLFPLQGNAKSRESGMDTKKMTTLDRLRAGVVLARDAVKAVSVTAMEALREGVAFIGISEKNELVDPFQNLDAPIWSEQPPQELLKLAYQYCEKLTIQEAGNFYHSFKYLPDEQRLAMCVLFMHFADEQTISQTAIGQTDSQEALAKLTRRQLRIENN